MPEFFATNLFDDRTRDAVADTVALNGTFTDRALDVPTRVGIRTQFKF